jgi:hypothetical protein
MNTTNPETEVETQETEANPVEAVETEVKDQAEEQDADPEGETEETADDETEEVEIEGEKYALPKKLKDKFMMNADYTRKTSELAETKRQFESQQAEAKQTLEKHNKYLKDFAELQAIDGQLQQFESVNWTQLINDDPIQAQHLQAQFNSLHMARGKRANDLSQKMQEDALKTQQDTAKRVQEGQARLQREIRDWSPEKERNLRDYAKAEYGIDVQENELSLLPGHTKALHKAFLYDQLMKKQAQKPITPEVKPVRAVGGAAKATSALPSDKDSIEVWMRKEKARLAKKQT